MNFDDKRPIYIQLLEDFRIKISTGAWPRGEKIDPVRALAKSYGVNPNTVQRALQDLEREGLCYSQRTLGRFVTDDDGKIARLNDKNFYKLADEFIEGVRNLNLARSKAIKMLDDYWEDNDDWD